MKSNITALMRFDADAPVRKTLLESPRLWSEVICLERAQEIGPFADANADALFVVLAGAAVLFGSKSRERLRQWESTLVAAGTSITLRSASEDPTVILAVTAPPPALSGGA